MSDTPVDTSKRTWLITSTCVGAVGGVVRAHGNRPRSAARDSPGRPVERGIDHGLRRCRRRERVGHGRRRSEADQGGAGCPRRVGRVGAAGGAADAASLAKLSSLAALSDDRWRQLGEQLRHREVDERTADDQPRLEWPGAVRVPRDRREHVPACRTKKQFARRCTANGRYCCDGSRKQNAVQRGSTVGFTDQFNRFIASQRANHHSDAKCCG